MKNTIHLITAICLLALAPLAQAIVLDSWTGGTGGSGASPSVGSGSTTLVAKLSESFTLGTVGDILTFSGEVTFVFPDTDSGSNSNFRWGLFDSNGSGGNTGWYGGYLTTNRSSGNAVLWEKDVVNADGSTGNWNSTGSYTQVSAAEITGGTSGGISLSAGTYSFSFTITRVTDGLLVSWSLVGTGDSTYSLVGTWLDTTPVTYSIDRVAIQTTSGFGQTSAAFANLSLTKTNTIPEPSTVALFFGLGVILITLSLKRRRNNSPCACC